MIELLRLAPKVSESLCKKMKEPCNNCPFRADRPFRGLLEEKANSIVQALYHDGGFHCHKIMDYSQNSRGRVTKNSKLCVGSAIFLENTVRGGMRCNVIYRLAIWAKELNPEELSKAVPVYKSVEEFVQGSTF